MKKAISIISVFLIAFSMISNSSAYALEEYDSYYETEIASDPFDPYDPSAPVYGARTGISYGRIGIGLLAIGAITAIIVTASNNSSSSHN